MGQTRLTRRDLLRTGAGTALALGAHHSSFALTGEAADQRLPRGKADACIFLWLGGGAGHIDTFDPKSLGDGKEKPGSYYPSIPTAIPGTRVCEHLSRTAPLMDRCIIVRSLTHSIVSQHGAASSLVHTGRTPGGTLIYPSIGSIVSHQLGQKTEEVPTYVVMGYPSITRDPGFLGARYGYVYLTQLETGRKISNVFDLTGEPASLRESYGGEFGQRCLLARRLVQAGVRFVEVSFDFSNGAGWDVHQGGIQKQHLLVRDLDQALSALLQDLERNQLLDTTLVVLTTEFGRPPEFDGGGGRGHHSEAFSALLAGGGLRTGQAIGVTDNLGRTILERPVTIPDFHATVHATLNIDPSKNLFAGNCPIPITDHGRPILEAFS